MNHVVKKLIEDHLEVHTKYLKAQPLEREFLQGMIQGIEVGLARLTTYDSLDVIQPIAELMETRKEERKAANPGEDLREQLEWVSGRVFGGVL